MKTLLEIEKYYNEGVMKQIRETYKSTMYCDDKCNECPIDKFKDEHIYLNCADSLREMSKIEKLRRLKEILK